MKLLLFIGNGFDLALGLKTSYKDFVNSDHWPFERNIHSDSIKRTDTLEYAIQKFTSENLDLDSGQVRWIDIEDQIRQYALNLSDKNSLFSPSPASKELPSLNRECLSVIKDAFSRYLLETIGDDFKNQSFTVNDTFRTIFGLIRHYDEAPVVYSFNYTDTHSALSSIAGMFGHKVTHVHGVVDKRRSDIVFGINDETTPTPDHRFFLKSFQSGYRTNKMIEDLESAETIIFYGMSFGANDINYFKEFFTKIVSEYPPQKKRTIYIFTLDDNSEYDIKNFILDAQVSVQQLYRYTKFHIVKISEFERDYITNESVNEFVLHMNSK